MVQLSILVTDASKFWARNQRIVSDQKCHFHVFCTVLLFLLIRSSRWSFQRPLFFWECTKLTLQFRRPFPVWPDMQIILCTINWHRKKAAYGNAISFLFFLSCSMESLTAINFYCQLKTSMVLCMVIKWYSCFSWNFFRQNLQCLMYIPSSNSNVLKTSRLANRNARQQLSEFTFPPFARTYSFVQVCPTLHDCRLYFPGMGFHKISFLIPGNQKWT